MARPTKEQAIGIAERRKQAIDMRMAGASYQHIADTLGYNSRGAACQDVGRALEQAVAEQTRSIEVYREEELQRLDMLLAEAWAVLKRQHVTVSHGRIVRDDTEEPILDDGPVLQAIDRILKIQERKAKFLGLDAPQKVSVDAQNLGDEIIDLIGSLTGSNRDDDTDD